MKFATKNLGTKFLFDEKDASAGFVVLRTAPLDVIAEINKVAVQKKSEIHPNPLLGKRLERIQYTETDDETYMRKLWDYCIADWSGVEDEDGTPIDCTAENKFMLMTKSEDFRNKVNEFLDVLNKVEKAEEEEIEKNS